MEARVDLDHAPAMPAQENALAVGGVWEWPGQGPIRQRRCPRRRGLVSMTGPPSRCIQQRPECDWCRSHRLPCQSNLRNALLPKQRRWWHLKHEQGPCRSLR